jgi:hypothetical protein
MRVSTSRARSCRSPGRVRGAIPITIGVALLACVPPLDASSLPCPCAPGWTCDTATDRCVSSGGGAPDGSAPASVCETITSPIFCSGFEDDGLDEWLLIGGDTARRTTDASEVRRGRASLHSTYAGPGGATTSVEARFSVASDDYWVRLEARYDRAAQDGAPIFSLFADAAAGPDMFINANASGTVYFLATFPRTTPPAGEWSMTSVGGIDVTEWHCYEGHVHRGAEGYAELFVDGDRVARFDGLDVSAPSAFDRLSVGPFYFTETEPAIEFDIDDVAVTRERVACP